MLFYAILIIFNLLIKLREIVVSVSDIYTSQCEQKTL